jgi:hypothetical protein
MYTTMFLECINCSIWVKVKFEIDIKNPNPLQFSSRFISDNQLYGQLPSINNTNTKATEV